MAAAHDLLVENRLLASLSPATLEFLAPHLERVLLPVGHILHLEHAEQTHVHFPVSGIVSLVNVLHDGSTSELGIAGNDGLIGLQGAMRARSAPHRAVVQVAGAAFRIRTRLLTERFKTDESLQDVLQRYSQFALIQVCQSVVCNRQHSLPQQFCRWILLSVDRLDCNDVRMTQQLVAVMLGVRREGISNVASQLKADGLIDYSRGRITVLDRAAVEAQACECYGAIVAEARRLFPEQPRY